MTQKSLAGFTGEAFSSPPSGGLHNVGDEPTLVFDEKIIVAEMNPVRSFRRLRQTKLCPIGDVIERSVAARDVLAAFVDVRSRVVGLPAARLVGVGTGEISARVQISLSRRGAGHLLGLGQSRRC